MILPLHKVPHTQATQPSNNANAQCSTLEFSNKQKTSQENSVKHRKKEKYLCK